MSSEEWSGEDDAPLGSLPILLRGAPQFLSPLEIGFSQWKVRHTFSDGRALAETAPAVTAVRCTPDEASMLGAPWKVEYPFESIEVVAWKCKLRDKKTGRPKVDPATGGCLYDSETRLFTLDNRRLYCLQRAAASVWPERCVCEVLELVSSNPNERMRELRKFRTVDSGETIMIGSTLDKVPFMKWSWRAAAGLKPESPGIGEVANEIQAALGLPLARGVPRAPQPAGGPVASAAPPSAPSSDAGAFLLKLVQEKEPALKAQGAALLGMLKGPPRQADAGQVLLSQLQGKSNAGGNLGAVAAPPVATGGKGGNQGKGAALLEQLQKPAPWEGCAPVGAGGWKGAGWQGKGSAWKSSSSRGGGGWAGGSW